MNRREFIITATGAAAASILPSVSFAADAVQTAIDAFANGASVKQGDDLSISMPEIAENGNTVPLTVSSDSQVTDLMLLADGNPNPNVGVFHFSPASGTVEASTRMRLAKTQNVIALARMSDGSVMRSDTLVKVTIGGCGG